MEKFEWTANQNKWEIRPVGDTYFDYGEIVLMANEDFTTSYSAYRGWGKMEQGLSHIGSFDNIDDAKKVLETLWNC